MFDFEKALRTTGINSYTDLLKDNNINFEPITLCQNDLSCSCKRCKRIKSKNDDVNVFMANYSFAYESIFKCNQEANAVTSLTTFLGCDEYDDFKSFMHIMFPVWTYAFNSYLESIDLKFGKVSNDFLDSVYVPFFVFNEDKFKRKILNLYKSMFNLKTQTPIQNIYKSIFTGYNLPFTVQRFDMFSHEILKYEGVNKDDHFVRGLTEIPRSYDDDIFTTNNFNHIDFNFSTFYSCYSKVNVNEIIDNLETYINALNFAFLHTRYVKGEIDASVESFGLKTDYSRLIENLDVFKYMDDEMISLSTAIQVREQIIYNIKNKPTPESSKNVKLVDEEFGIDSVANIKVDEVEVVSDSVSNAEVSVVVEKLLEEDSLESDEILLLKRYSDIYEFKLSLINELNKNIKAMREIDTVVDLNDESIIFFTDAIKVLIDRYNNFEDSMSQSDSSNDEIIFDSLESAELHLDELDDEFYTLLS